MTTPTDRRYSDSHEWFRLDGDVVTVGLTQFAVNELTDITYVEMKPEGEAISKGDSLGEVESVKTTSDVHAAIDGEVVESNQAVVDDPSLINNDPYGEGWLIRVRIVDAGVLDALMEQDAYDKAHPVD